MFNDSKQFRNVFKEFPYFNYIQSKAMDELLYSDKNFVICAPTGSGKTVIFELSIIRLLVEAPMPWTNIKVVYMAPIKALCGQRFDDWKEKFGPIGLNCKELTGDTQIDDLFEIQHAHIIMTTPEKWDSMTRKWRDNTLVQLVRLFLIDEVHTVKDENRGATLEVVVSRMKTIQSSLSRVYKQSEVLVPMRFVAVSATIPNAEDVAEWLSDGRHSAVCMKIDETHRPVKLRKVVLGFPCTGNQTEFKFDLSLNYKIAGVIQTYSDQKPTLVFCATRKGVQQAASVLAKDAKFIMSIEHKQRLQKSANAIKDAKLRDLLTYGVGYHHAGVDISDRKVIEAAFTKGDLPVLFTTSTLAMGVNLPAHLVIIKSTMHYASGMYQEYSETDILQMIGRAGRPQFDTTATAVIMTRLHTREKYVQMLDGADTIESSLHKHLIEHLNAEVTLHTITDVNIALEWIRSTFLYIRALKNPTHYGFQKGLNKTGIEAKLQELCLKNLNDLSSVGLIKMDEETNFKPTETGKLMALYYIAFDTAKLFQRINGKETLPEMITMIAACSEFSDVQLRTSEKRLLNTLNKDKNRITIRYPMEGKIKSREMKVNCLIQAQFGCIPVQDFSLTQDIAKIFRHGTRITKCLSEFMALQEKKFVAFLNSLILTKCFRSKLWENSLHVSKQLEKIGVTLANAMVNSGLTSFKKIEDTNPREIEMIVNRHPPFGNQIKEAVTYLPKYEIGFEQITRYSQTIAEVVATIVLKNFEQLQKKRTAPVSHYVTLLIGDADNEVVFKQKIMDSALIKTGTWTKKIEIKRAIKSEELSINLISSDYVGLDIQQKFCVFYLGPKMFSSDMVDQGKAEDTLLKGKYDSGKIIHNADGEYLSIYKIITCGITLKFTRRRQEYRYYSFNLPQSSSKFVPPKWSKGVLGFSVQDANAQSGLSQNVSTQSNDVTQQDLNSIDESVFGLDTMVNQPFDFVDSIVLEGLRNMEEEYGPEDSDIPIPVKHSSNFYPVQFRGPALNLYQKRIEREILALEDTVKQKKITESNLTKKEKLALASLENNTNLVIRNSDKGGNVVVLNKKDYVQESNRQLNDPSTYRKMDSNPMHLFKAKLIRMLEKTVTIGLLTREQLEFLIPENPRIPIFHYLPKTHKSLTQPPRRPIISGIGSLFEPTSEWMDSILQPLVRSLKSYLRDSTHLLQLLKNLIWKKEYKWIVVDATALYSSIPHHMDDLIFIVREPFEYNDFLTYLGQNEFNLKFVGDMHETVVDLLDLTLKGDVETGEVISDTFRKLTAGNTILHARSCHPPHLVQSIPRDQLMRLRRNTNLDSLFEVQAKALIERLKLRSIQVRRAES
ncbi:probable ATP-dependent DNA helicase HFM1 [Bombina bombina]|uniref:probable ATP-dependent DNA helicase HFM1 n=1 Tax=Bombina bombina TaxID=8345 RepID=UPI00235B1C1E|nr:probable ATP-dependent DNA helicase HFM1 [Bombina bombina]